VCVNVIQFSIQWMCALCRNCHHCQ